MITIYFQKLLISEIVYHVILSLLISTQIVLNTSLLVYLIDYLAISETKLDSSFPKSQFGFVVYVLYRQDLTSSCGGLIVYIRDDLSHRRLFNSEKNEDGFESLGMEHTTGKSKTVITCVYKHPKCQMIFSWNACRVSLIQF